MDELSVFSIAYWIVLGILMVMGLTGIVVQIFKIGRWNLSPIYFGTSCAMVICGAMFASHEMWLSYINLMTVTGALKRHVVLADGISTALSVMFVYFGCSMAIGLIGSVLAYIREWLFREGLS